MESGITVAVAQGANAPSRRQLADGEPQSAHVEVVNEAAPAQPGGPRPDGWAADAPLPPDGGTRHVQRAQREAVRTATSGQLSQANPIARPARRK